MLFFILGIMIFSQGVSAQNEHADNSGVKKKVKSATFQKKKNVTKTQANTKKSKSVSLTGSDGKPVEVPLDANLEDYLNWLKTKKGIDYAINAISISGTAKEKYVDLKAELTVQLLRDRGWVRVPLTLNEGVLRNSKYEGKGEASFDKFDRERGYFWWFRGKGYHKLILELTVPIDQANSSQRLQLTLPPRTAASSLKLKVPYKKVKTEFGKETVVETKTLDATHSEIKVIGLGEQIDGRWTSIREPSNSKPVFKVHSAVVAKLSLETAVLRVKQRIEPIQGSTKELFVKIPAAFEVLQVEGAGYKSYRKVEENAEWYAVTMTEPQTEPVTLEWTLQSTFHRSSPAVFDLQGFEVRDAVRQTGEIAVVLVDGIRAIRTSVADRFIDRIRRSEYRDIDFLQDSTPNDTYAFLKQPFRFSRRIEEIKPFLSVTPTATMVIDAKEAKLTATYRCKIRERKGIVREIPLRWTNWQKHGWKIQSIESQGLFDNALKSFGSEIDVPVLKFRQPQNDDFEFTIRAIRELKENDDRFEIDFPQVVASKNSSLNLDVRIADELEVSLTSRDSSKLMELFRQQGQRQYRIDPGNESLAFQYSIHEPEVVATNSCTVGIDKNRLKIEQRISFQIHYFRTSEIRLWVPEEILSDLEIFLENDSLALQFQPNAVDLGSRKQVSVTLPNPAIGTVELLLKYSVKIPRLPSLETPSLCELAFVNSAEHEFDHTRFTFRNSEQYLVQVKDSNWQQEVDANGTSAWEISQNVSRVNLELSISRLQTSQRFSVKRAFIASSLNRDGSSLHRAQFLIAGFPTKVTLKWPKGAIRLGIWWNKERIEAENVRRKNVNDETITLELPQRNPFSGQNLFLLSVDYYLPQNRIGQFVDLRTLKAPAFLSPVWIEQTKWLVQMPRDLYVGQTPSQFEADYRWQRTGLAWKRTSRLDRSECDIWVSAERGPDSIFDSSSDHYYLFARQGNAETLSLTTISRAKLIFLGAGFALLAGLLFLRTKRLQNTIVTLSGCFVFSFLGIWFSEWMQLLLQPALLGLSLALIAVGIDTFIRRRRTSVVMTVPGNGELRARYAIESQDSGIETNRPVSSTVTNEHATHKISELPLAAPDVSSK